MTPTIAYNSLALGLLWFSTWTVGANVIALFGLPASTLTAWFALTSSGVLAVLIAAARRRTWLEVPALLAVDGSQRIDFSSPPSLRLAGVAACGLAAALVAYGPGSSWGFLLLLVAAWVMMAAPRPGRGDEPACPPAASRADTPQLAVLIAVLLAMYLFGHQPDSDDANFINLGLGAFRTRAGVLELDTMLGDGPTELHLPTYRLHSYELLYATLGALLPGQAIHYAHLVLPVVALIAMGLVLYLMYRAFLGKHFLAAGLLHLAILLLAFDNFRSLGAHGVFRMYQGKIVFMQVLVPLSALLACAAYRAQAASTHVLLALAQVASVGLTANAVYAGPLCVGLVALSQALGRAPTRDSLLRLLRLLACVAYPMLAGLSILVTSGARPSQFTETEALADAIFSYLSWSVPGIGLVAFYPLATAVVGFVWASDVPRRYFLAVLVFIFNPLLWPLYSRVTGVLNFRVFWSVLFVPTLALGAVASLLWLLPRLRRAPVGNATLAAVVLILALVYGTRLRAHPHEVRFAWPGLRVEEGAFQAALWLVSHADPACRVLAPSRVAGHLTTLEGHPYPVAVDKLYQLHYRHTMADGERALRSDLLAMADHEQELDQARLQAGLREFQVGSLLVSLDHPELDLLQSFLAARGFSERPPIGGRYQPFVGACASANP